MTQRRQALGQAGEDLAADHLESKGYLLLARRFRTRLGEIDLVARIGATVVFVEVKTRTGTGFGRPEEAVGFAKQAKLARMAGIFLASQPTLAADGTSCRFDVISILWREGSAPVLEHLEDAFRAT